MPIELPKQPTLSLADLGSSLVVPRLNLGNAFTVGFKEIWAHKFRSLLTMLGIILGVSSLVAMSALVKGMEVGAKEALIAIGGCSLSNRLRDPPTLTDQGAGSAEPFIWCGRRPSIARSTHRSISGGGPPSR